MITSIYFENFKALKDFSLSIKEFNILTGPNNNGKSTILDAFRILEGAYRFASRYNPKYITLPNGKGVYGYEIPQSSLPIILENIQTDFSEEESLIRFRFRDDQNLFILFTPNCPTYMYFETPRKTPANTSQFKKEFPLKIGIVPTLGPFEINEEIVQEDYLKRWAGSRRAPRLFRNYWFFNREKFPEFKGLVEGSWDGVSIGLPEKKDMFSRELVMFCTENRMTREICWSGFGFQIWLQLITHLVMSNGSDILIIDEPEIYLHPDLQHKLLAILKELKATVILATHSVEIINSAEPNEVILIDKKSKSGKRISDLDGLQGVSDVLGSGQNIQLTRLARGKKILFVEGADAKLLAKFSKVLGFSDVLPSGDITVIPIQGFSQYERILSTNWAFSKILGEELKIAALLDRDYRPEEEIADLHSRLSKEIAFAHIFKWKELENYLLLPQAILKAIEYKLEDRIRSGTIKVKPTIDIYKTLSDITENFRSEISGQLIANLARKSKKEDLATIISKLTKEFDEKWKDLYYRLRVAPGKLILSKLNEFLTNTYKISITPHQILAYTNKNELDPDIVAFLQGLDAFRKT